MIEVYYVMYIIYVCKVYVHICIIYYYNVGIHIPVQYIKYFKIVFFILNVSLTDLHFNADFIEKLIFYAGPSGASDFSTVCG